MWAWVAEFFTVALVAGAVAACVTLLWMVARRALAKWDKPWRGDERVGAIRPWPPIWWLFALMFSPMLVFSVVAVFTESPWWLLAVCLFGALTSFSALYGLPQSALRWDERGVEGLSSQFGFGRRRLNWDAIARSGLALSGVYYIEDHRGDRVYWAWTHIGYWHFWNVVLQRRPDLVSNIQETASLPVG